ncbi:hypothetical protein [Hydrogenoanaerobacterium sp.]|uniref:hypothetical protein n=1 Tax=Hydrogenoanaerobacterium sp. TaxID=2953763 RepID=UPI002899666C|nr:hypothetical protein [Hydrogenoanaerobacterium sp.]
MKQAMIYKGFAPEELSAENLTEINRYTRRELKAEEVYVFPLILCDNEIDRDFERFSVDALYKLRRLFLGKTGIFDHNPKGANQTARIFHTAVEQDTLRKTTTGEVYHFLTAKAYMVRSDKNKDLILDIDAGIKKEVSVGCAVEEVLCSTCGKNVKQQPCRHKSGQTYDGVQCHYTLSKPTDTYEWSFVAVPAQPAAGVTKAYSAPDTEEHGSLGMIIAKLKAAQKSVELSCGDAELLGAELQRLRGLAQVGEAYRGELKKEVLRCAALSGSGISPKAVAAIADKLTTEELRELKKSFACAGGNRPVPTVQTAGSFTQGDGGENSQFLI